MRTIKKLLSLRNGLLLLCALLAPLLPARASTYAEAVTRAQDFFTLPTDNNLLTLDYTQLVTTNIGGTAYLEGLTLMKGSTWTNYYMPYVGATSARSNNIGNETWITFDPELKGYMDARTNEFDVNNAASIAARAEQALGMTNNATHLFAVDIFVATSSIFRPTINWSPTNSVTIRDWTGQDQSGPTWFAGVYGEDYYDWFTNRQQTVYSGNNAFPWTGLGYTYDWYYATNSPGIIGPSEFVIGAQQTYYVASGTPVDQYFAIPEPSIGALFLVGVVLALGWRRRNR